MTDWPMPNSKYKYNSQFFFYKGKEKRRLGDLLHDGSSNLIVYKYRMKSRLSTIFYVKLGINKVTNIGDPIRYFVCFPVNMTNNPRSEGTKWSSYILNDMSNLPIKAGTRYLLLSWWPWDYHLLCGGNKCYFREWHRALAEGRCLSHIYWRRTKVKSCGLEEMFIRILDDNTCNNISTMNQTVKV